MDFPSAPRLPVNFFVHFPYYSKQPAPKQEKKRITIRFFSHKISCPGANPIILKRQSRISSSHFFQTSQQGHLNLLCSLSGAAPDCPHRMIGCASGYGEIDLVRVLQRMRYPMAKPSKAVLFLIFLLIYFLVFCFIIKNKILKEPRFL